MYASESSTGERTGDPIRASGIAETIVRGGETPSAETSVMSLRPAWLLITSDLLSRDHDGFDPRPVGNSATLRSEPPIGETE